MRFIEDAGVFSDPQMSVACGNSALAASGSELLYRYAHRHTRFTAFARGDVNVLAAASKTGLRQATIQAGVFGVAGVGKYRYGLALRQIAASVGRRCVKGE